MTLLTHTPTVLLGTRALTAQRNIHSSATPSSHIAMIKRFTKFALALAAITLVVAAVAATKLAIFYPRFFH